MSASATAPLSLQSAFSFLVAASVCRNSRRAFGGSGCGGCFMPRPRSASHYLSRPCLLPSSQDLCPPSPPMAPSLSLTGPSASAVWHYLASQE